MRGPLRTVWNSTLLGSYLRFRLAFAFALSLATIGAAVALSVGGLAGILFLSGVVFLGLMALTVALTVR